MPDADPLEGREIDLLNSMLAALQTKARAGDEAAVDRVLKILDLKRKYKRDKMLEEQY
jgi:nitrate reductase beta subunit